MRVGGGFLVVAAVLVQKSLVRSDVCKGNVAYSASSNADSVILPVGEVSVVHRDHIGISHRG